MSNLFIYTFMCVCKLAKYVRNYVVFWKNLHSWQNFYTNAGRDGRDKFQVCIYASMEISISSLIRWFGSSYIHLFILHLNCSFHPDVRELFETMQGDAWRARIFGENIFWQNNRLVLFEIFALVVQNNNFHRFKDIWCECFHCHSSKKR